MVDQKRDYRAATLVYCKIMLEVANESCTARGNLHTLSDEQLIELIARIIKTALLLGRQVWKQGC